MNPTNNSFFRPCKLAYLKILTPLFEKQKEQFAKMCLQKMVFIYWQNPFYPQFLLIPPWQNYGQRIVEQHYLLKYFLSILCTNEMFNSKLTCVVHNFVKVLISLFA
jgi:hypothetical protein